MVKSIKHASTAIIDQFFVSGGNFLTIVICANILSLEEMGKVGYAYVIYVALLLINNAGIYQPGVINLHKQSNKNKYIGFLAWLQVIYAIPLAVLAILLLSFFGEIFDWSASYDELLSVFLFLLFLQFAEFGRRIFYALDLPKFSAGISAVQYAPRLLLLIIISPLNAEAVFLIHALCALLPTLVVVVIIIKNNKVIHLFNSFVREHLLHNYPLSITAILGWTTFASPVFILGVLVGKESVAILMSFRSITNSANVLLELLETIVPTKFIKSLVNGGLEELKRRSEKLLGYGLGVWIAGLVVFILFSEDLISLLLGEKYTQYSEILIILWLSVGIHFISRVNAIYHRVQLNLKLEMYGTLFGLVASLILSYVLGARFEVLGIAWTYVVISITILITQHLYMRRLQ